MSRRIHVHDPLNQKRFDNVAVVWLEKGGKRYEVAAYKNKIVQWRYGVETDKASVFQVVQVFRSVTNGEAAPKKELLAAFGTDDIEKAAQYILDNGKYQLNAMERQEEEKQALGHLANYISDTSLYPVTHTGWDQLQIRNALADVGFSFKLDKPMKVQAQNAIKLLQGNGIKIVRAPREMELTARTRERLDTILKVTGSTVIEYINQKTARCLVSPDRVLHLMYLAERTKSPQPQELQRYYRNKTAGIESSLLPQLPDDTQLPKWAPSIHWAMPRAFDVAVKLLLMYFKRLFNCFMPHDIAGCVLQMINCWAWHGVSYIDFNAYTHRSKKTQKKIEKYGGKKGKEEAEKEDVDAGDKSKISEDKTSKKPKGKKGTLKKNADLDDDSDDGRKAKGKKRSTIEDANDLRELEKRIQQKLEEKKAQAEAERISKILEKKNKKKQSTEKVPAAEPTPEPEPSESTHEAGDSPKNSSPKVASKKQKRKGHQEDTVFGRLFDAKAHEEKVITEWGFYEGKRANEDESLKYEKVVEPSDAFADAVDDESEPEGGELVGPSAPVRGLKPKVRKLPNGKKVSVVGQATINTSGQGPALLY